MAEHLPTFGPGPLDRYRKFTSFEWKKLKTFLYTDEGLQFQNRLCNEVLKYPVFFDEDVPANLDETRRIGQHKTFAFKKLEDITLESLNNPYKKMVIFEILNMIDFGCRVKYLLGFHVFVNVLRTLGTKRHEHLIEKSLNGDIFGCFCLTEIGHGSNVKGMRTTATYDPVSKHFILHSPDFQAAKGWIGNLAKTAAYANVFAQLITPDGVNHGLHTFVVSIRDPKTLLPYPGIKIGDMGEKLGVHGIDNGFMMFDNYHIPYESLLNKLGDVTIDGKYQTPFDDSNKRHGATLATLSEGRIEIVGDGTAFLTNAVTIAIRYAAVRKQFNADEGDEEVPILEYQSHQHRLLPYLASAYAFRIFTIYIYEVYNDLTRKMRAEIEDPSLSDVALEFHAVSSACKAVVGWAVRDGIQESREACGGHGYLKASRLGDLRNNHDPSCTYEGENHILIQQTSNWLLKFWPLVLTGKPITTPFKSVHYLNSAKTILSTNFSARSVEEFTEPKYLLGVFQWLVCYMVKTSFEKYHKLIEDASDKRNLFWAKNNSQVFHAKNLAIIYIQHLILEKMYLKALEAPDQNIKLVLMRLFTLYGVSCLEKHIPILYSSGYASGPNASKFIQESILRFCELLKDDAVGLVDVIAPPDFVLNSVLGYSDGQVYKHLEAALIRAPEVFSRPNWWREVVNWKDHIQYSKL